MFGGEQMKMRRRKRGKRGMSVVAINRPEQQEEFKVQQLNISESK